MSLGPAVVALGGGHGLAATLSAVRSYAGQITAVVSVADDGGSSGHLRHTLGVAPVGDLRRCLSALSMEGSLLGSSLEYRFPAGDLEGHALGNVLLAGLIATAGDLVSALDEVGRAIGAVGRVLPAATEPLTLTGLASDGGTHLKGQVAVQNAGGVTRVVIGPAEVATPQAALDAIAGADQLVLGPGSLFTSVLPAVIVPVVLAALHAAATPKIYVCNLGPEVPETAGFTVADHVRVLQDHGVPVDVVLCHPGAMPAGRSDVKIFEAPVARPNRPAHDPALLGAALAALYEPLGSAPEP